MNLKEQVAKKADKILTNIFPAFMLLGPFSPFAANKNWFVPSNITEERSQPRGPFTSRHGEKYWTYVVKTYSPTGNLIRSETITTGSDPSARMTQADEALGRQTRAAVQQHVGSFQISADQRYIIIDGEWQPIGKHGI